MTTIKREITKGIYLFYFPIDNIEGIRPGYYLFNECKKQVSICYDSRRDIMIDFFNNRVRYKTEGYLNNIITNKYRSVQNG